jgi:hypothetical protein
MHRLQRLKVCGNAWLLPAHQHQPTFCSCHEHVDHPTPTSCDEHTVSSGESHSTINAKRPRCYRVGRKPTRLVASHLMLSTNLALVVKRIVVVSSLPGTTAYWMNSSIMTSPSAWIQTYHYRRTARMKVVQRPCGITATQGMSQDVSRRRKSARECLKILKMFMLEGTRFDRGRCN